MPVQQSVCYPIFVSKDSSLDQLFKTIRSIGYPAVELWGRGSDFGDVTRLARKHKLAIASMVGHKSLTPWTRWPPGCGAWRPTRRRRA